MSMQNTPQIAVTVPIVMFTEDDPPPVPAASVHTDRVSGMDDIDVWIIRNHASPYARKAEEHAGKLREIAEQLVQLESDSRQVEVDRNYNRTISPRVAEDKKEAIREKQRVLDTKYEESQQSLETFLQCIADELKENSRPSHTSSPVEEDIAALPAPSPSDSNARSDYEKIDEFLFAGTISDFGVGYIHKEGNKSKGQKMNRGKKRYLWQFLAQNYGTEQTLVEATKFVAQALGRNIKIKAKDMENVLGMVAAYSSLSRSSLGKYFMFESQQVSLRTLEK